MSDDTLNEEVVTEGSVAEPAVELTEEEKAKLEAEEAARLEAERLAAEEAARLEAERLEAERLEAERLAKLEEERKARVKEQTPHAYRLIHYKWVNPRETEMATAVLGDLEPEAVEIAQKQFDKEQKELAEKNKPGPDAHPAAVAVYTESRRRGRGHR